MAGGNSDNWISVVLADARGCHFPQNLMRVFLTFLPDNQRLYERALTARHPSNISVQKALLSIC